MLRTPFLLLFSALGTAQEIPWIHGGLTDAQAQESPIAVYFWMEGSDFCSRFYSDTLTQPEAATALEGVACLSADIGTKEGGELFAKYGVTQVPATLFLTSSGEPDDVVLGYAPLSAFVAEVGRIRAGTGTVSDLRAQLKDSPDDLALVQQLGVKYIDVGRAAEGEALFMRIREADPKGQTEVGARLHLRDARDKVAGEADDASDIRTWKMDELVRHVGRIDPPRVRFEGFDLLARLYSVRGEYREMFDAWREAHETLPADRLVEFAYQYGGMAWEQRQDLRAADKRFFVKVSRELVEHAKLEDKDREETGKPLTDESVTRPDALGLLAQAEFLAGNKRKALEALDQALEIDPGNATLIARREEFAR